MSIKTIFNSMSSANFVYGNITDMDMDTVMQDSWAITQDGIRYIGTVNPVVTLTDKLIVKPEPTPIDLTIAAENLLAQRTTRWELLKQERLSRTTERGVLVSGKWFHTDVLSRSQYAQLGVKANTMLAGGSTLDDVIMANSGPVIWKTMDNSFIPMTVQLVQLVLDALFNQEALVFRTAEANRDMIYRSLDPVSFVSSGWPQTFYDL
jgi:hypothetical protein